MAKDSKFYITITPEACIGAALMLILIPLPWLCTWLLAAVIHELCHCLALILLRDCIYGVEIGIDGAKIQTGVLPDGHALLCSLAGPIGGLLLLPAAAILPRLAVCGFLQSVFNLLPIYPLDGGRALLSFARLVFPENVAYKIYRTIEIANLAIFLILGGLAALVWNLGILPLAIAILLALRVKK